MAAAAAANTAASVAVSGGTSSVTTGANGGNNSSNNDNTGCTSDWPDYSGVDSTTSPFERPTPDLSLSDVDHHQQQTAVSISSGTDQIE